MQMLSRLWHSVADPLLLRSLQQDMGGFKDKTVSTLKGTSTSTRSYSRLHKRKSASTRGFPLLWFLIFYLLIFRERERGEKRQCQRETPIIDQLPLNLQPRHVPWPGIQPATFCFVGNDQTSEPHGLGQRPEVFAMHWINQLSRIFNF